MIPLWRILTTSFCTKKKWLIIAYQPLFANTRNVFLQNLRAYLTADKRYQRVTEIDGYGRAWQDYLLENPDEYLERLNQSIDAAFSSLTVLRKEYKKLTNAQLFDGGIGCARRDCTDEEWNSFRPEKAEVLDEVYTYLTLRLQEQRRNG